MIGDRPEPPQGQAAFDAAIHAIHYEPNTSDVPIHRQELQAMFDAYLGKGYDPEKVEVVAELQNILRVVNRYYVRVYDSGELTEAEYIKKMSEFTDVIFHSIEEVLGHDDFVTLFGVHGAGR